MGKSVPPLCINDLETVLVEAFSMAKLRPMRYSSFFVGSRK